MSRIEMGKGKGGSGLDRGTDTGTPGPGNGTMTGAERSAGMRGSWPGRGPRMIGKERGSSGRRGSKAGTRGTEVSRANGRQWRCTWRGGAEVSSPAGPVLFPFQYRTHRPERDWAFAFLGTELESTSRLGKCPTTEPQMMDGRDSCVRSLMRKCFHTLVFPAREMEAGVLKEKGLIKNLSRLSHTL